MADAPRERWSSSTAFVFAAIGSAIGLANLWRFPAKCFEYGGGTFLLPYSLALVLIGFPLLILEIGLGQAFQGGHVVAFGRMHKRLRFMGLASAWCTLGMISFYVPLISWFIRMFGYSFYANEDGSVIWQQSKYIFTEGGAFDWVKTNIFGVAENSDLSGTPKDFIFENFACLVLAWLFIWLSVFFGVKVTGYLSYVVVTLTGLFFCVLFVFGVTRMGSDFGVTQFIGLWDLTELIEKPTIWSDAVSQIFFSLGLTLGIMTAYGSYNDEKRHVAKSAYIIAIVNSAYSLLAGFSVFSALGHLSFLRADGFISMQNNSTFFADNVTTNVTPLHHHYLTRNSTFPDTTNCVFDLPFFSLIDALADKNGTVNAPGGDPQVKPIPGRVLHEETSPVLGHKPAKRFQPDVYRTWFDMKAQKLIELDREKPVGEPVKLFATDIIEDFRFSTNQTEGPVLAFGSYPIVLAFLPVPHFWNAIFFLTLILLGTDSAFASVEAIATVLLDTKIFQSYSRKQVVTGLCFVCFLFTIPYSTDTGYHLLDIMNKYFNVVLLWIGLFETIAAGWVYRIDETVKKCGLVPTFMLAATVFVPTISGCAVGFGIVAPKGNQNVMAVMCGMSTSIILAVILLVGTLVAQARHGNMTAPYSERVEELFFGNIEYLRDRIKGAFLKNFEKTNWWRGIPKYVWSFNIKFFCPVTLTILIANALAEKDENEEYVFARYHQLNTSYQALGVMLALLSVFLVLIGIVIPPGYLDFLEKHPLDEEPEFMQKRRGLNVSRREDLGNDDNVIEAAVPVDLGLGVLFV
eukprot:GEMP01002591.1.p1 GENE.GEMP01002591.1~~GEMP01002591.1.p1  ORF type:complete len:800 (+),score=165.34 GEMP01002591.1:184-2583(+)